MQKAPTFQEDYWKKILFKYTEKKKCSQGSNWSTREQEVTLEKKK